MKTTLLFGSIIAIISLASCKQAGDMHDTAPASNDKPSEDQVATAQAKSPKMLLARVKVSELNQPKSQVEIVSLDQQTTITNGEQAAQAFAAGQPMQIVQTDRGPHAVNANYKIALSATNVASSKQMSLGDVVIGYPTNYGAYPGGYGSGAGYQPFTPVSYNNGVPTYPTNGPYGGVGAPYGNGGYGSGGMSGIFASGGGWLSYLGAMFHGVQNTIGGLLSALNPFNWLGNIGVGYGSTGGCPNAGYQYYPYNQIPTGPVITSPYPNQIPQPYYPNQQYPNQPTYPNQQYPNQPIPGQPTVPTAPTGQEQMPQI